MNEQDWLNTLPKPRKEMTSKEWFQSKVEYLQSKKCFMKTFYAVEACDGKTIEMMGVCVDHIAKDGKVVCFHREMPNNQTVYFDELPSIKWQVATSIFSRKK